MEDEEDSAIETDGKVDKDEVQEAEIEEAQTQEDGDVTSDEEDETDDDDDDDTSDEEDTELENEDENEGEETFITPDSEENDQAEEIDEDLNEDLDEELVEEDDEEVNEEAEEEAEEEVVEEVEEEVEEEVDEEVEEEVEEDNDFDDGRHDSKDPEVYPTLSTTETTTKTTTTTSTTITTTIIATTVTTTEEPVTTTKEITTTTVDIAPIWDKEQCEGMVHGLKMQMAAGRCYTVFDHVPHGVTARMAYKKCRGFTSNGGRPLTLLGLTRFNNQEEVAEALRDVVVDENGCGGFWTAAKNAPIRRQSNRADSSNAIIYNENNMEYTNANIEFVSDQTKIMMRENGVKPCQNDSGYSEFDDYNYLQVICFYAF